MHAVALIVIVVVTTSLHDWSIAAIAQSYNVLFAVAAATQPSSESVLAVKAIA